VNEGGSTKEQCVGCDSISCELMTLLSAVRVVLNYRYRNGVAVCQVSFSIDERLTVGSVVSVQFCTELIVCTFSFSFVVYTRRVCYIDVEGV